MSKSSRWLLAGGALLLAVVVVPYGVESGVAGMLRDRLTDRSVDVEWRELSWNWTDRFSLGGLQVESSGGRRLEIRRLEADLAVGALLGGKLQVDELRLVGLRGELDLSHRAGESTEKTNREPATGSEPASVERLRMLLGRVSLVVLEEASIELMRGEAALGNWKGELRASSTSGVLEGDGAVRLGSASEANKVEWMLEGEVEEGWASVTGEVDISGERGRLAYGPGRLAFAGLSFELSLAPTVWVEVSLEKPEVRLAHDGASVLEMTGPRVSLAARPSATSPELSVGARKLQMTGDTGAMRAVFSRGGSSGSSNGSGKTTPADLLHWAIESVDVDLRETQLRLRHTSGDTTRTLAPAESVHLRKNGRRLAVTGDIAGGQLRSRVRWEPGFLWPARAAVWLDEIDLEEIPIVREGRSAPNRGVRGEVGGRLDVTATLMQLGLPGTLRERTAGHLKVGWHDGWIDADGLAKKPVRGIDTSLRLTGEWRPAVNRLRLRKGRFRYGSLAAELDGALTDWPIDPVFDFDAYFEKFDCQKAVGMLSDELLGPYRDVALQGEARPKIGLELPLRRPEKLSLNFDGFPGECDVTALNAERAAWPKIDFRQLGSDGASGATTETGESRSARRYAAPPNPKEPLPKPRAVSSVPGSWSPGRPEDVFWLKRPFVQQVTEGVDKGATVRVGPGLDSYVPLEKMPSFVGAAAYLSEEVNFYRDGAWNMALIERALRMNFKEERFVYGGSTVTQQLVKNLFLTRRKTLARKVREALIAWRMQGVVSKDRVLELYLNCIEFGENLYGIGPAAKHYFDKPASKLTPLEAVFLAAIKPAPWYGDRFKKRGSTPESGWWRERLDEIMGRLVDKGFVSRERAEKARPYVLEW